MFYVGIVEHSAVNDTAARQMIESIARYLFATNENIISACGTGLQPEFLQHVFHHKHIAVECKIHIACGSDIRKHYIALVGIDATATTLAAIHLYIVRLAIGGVDLAVNKLVATKNNRGGHLPHKEIVGSGERACDILLHCKIERKRALFFYGECHIYHTREF